MWGGRKGSACQAAAVSALSAKVDARDGAAAAAAAAAGHAAPQQLPYPEFTLADFGGSLLPLSVLPLVRQAASTGGLHSDSEGVPGALGTGGLWAVFEATIYGGSLPVAVKVTRRGGEVKEEAQCFCWCSSSCPRVSPSL